MTFDLEKFWRLDMGYPGRMFGYHTWALGAYLESLENFIGFAQEQYKLRGKRALDADRDKLLDEEYGQELAELEEAADYHIPRFARLAALVPIWGLFESTVTDITAYVARREDAKLKLREIRAANFRDQVEKYYLGVLRIPLPWSDEDKESAMVLHGIRNAVAHRNGDFFDATERRREEIAKLVDDAPGVEFQGNQVVVSAEYVEAAAAIVFRMLAQLNSQVSDLYEGPIVPDDA